MAGSIPDPFRELFAAIPALTGRPAAAEDRGRFKHYLELFMRWNQVHRMTALRSPVEIIRGLFLDSLLFLPVLPLARPIKVADIGAGSGIPGLPIRVVDSGIVLTLVEAKRKRVSFLHAVCRDLELRDVSVIEGRAETLVEDEGGLAGAFDAVVARAVGPANLLLPLAIRYLKPGGTVVLAGGPKSTGLAGLETVRVRRPGAPGSRTFLRAAKESNVPRGT